MSHTILKEKSIKDIPWLKYFNQVTKGSFSVAEFYMLRLADSQLILSHRLQELCGKTAPLEEDLAISNIALDLLGQARLLYQAIVSGAGESSKPWASEDEIVMKRDERFYFNLLLLEQANRDFAHIMLRQYLFDSFSLELWVELCRSKCDVLQKLAEKFVPEHEYHLEHSQHWMRVFLGGTDESYTRLKQAWRNLYPFIGELFQEDEIDTAMKEGKMAASLSDIRKSWQEKYVSLFKKAGIEMPEKGRAVYGGKQGRHQEYLGYILADIQYMQRSYPGLQW